MLLALLFTVEPLMCTKIPKGPVVFRATSASIHPPSKPTVTTVYESGYVTTVTGDKTSAACLASSHPFVHEIAAAKFEFTPAGVCDALATESLTFEAPQRKKKISFETPCGRVVDPTTQALIDAFREAMKGR